MISITKTYIAKLNDIVSEYNNTYSAIKMKPPDAKSTTCFDLAVENNQHY